MASDHHQLFGLFPARDFSDDVSGIGMGNVCASMAR